jgi:uncharacterized repeat protein (TIGR01451 family)
MTYAAARRGRSQVVWLTVLFLLSMLVQYASFSGPAAVMAAHDEGIFELDGNALDENDPLPDPPEDDDWENGTPGAADTFFVGAASEAAANDTTYLQTGNSKDENDISSWVIATTGAPDKNELLDAYAAVYLQGGDTWVYFGADRFDNDGTAQIGFWFFQDDIGISGGSFTGGHVDGDVLIISEYTNGGVVSTICAYVWDPDDDGDNIETDVDCDPATNGSNLDLVAAGVSCDVADGTYDICAVSNADTEDAPWTFLNKDSESDFGPGQFFEGGLNLSDMFGGDAPCFGSFLAETRTSAETDAQLKDIAFGDFNTCLPPTITTQSSVSAADFGQAVTDTATLSGTQGAVTGTVDFFICTPAQVTAGGCEGSAGTQVGSSVAIVAGSATSAAYNVGTTAAAAGKYCWRAEYNPASDANYAEGSHTNATTECFTVAPATISITKTANPAGPVLVGGEIGFDITVTNTGTTTTLGITVTDNLPAGIVWTADAPTGSATGVSCSINTAPNPDVLTCTDASLAAGQSWTVHIHGTTDAGDCGTVSNTASVATTNDGSGNDTDTVDVSCPALNIEKSSTTTQITVAGQVVPYTFTLTNTGNVTLTGITVTDPNCDSGPTYQSGDTNSDDKLQVTETWTYTCNHTVTQAEIDTNGGGDGDLDNTVTADSNETGPDTDDLAIPIVQDPELSILKTDGDATFDSIGDVIVYNVRVTNTGNVTLTNVLVTDPNAPDIDCSAAAGQQTTIPSLAPGAFVDCSASHTVTQADLDAGFYLNTACADDGNGDGTTGADPVCEDENTPGEQDPALDVVKTATNVDGDSSAPFLVDEAGDVISYSIVVTNTGNVTLHNVSVNDPLLSDEDCDGTPGEPFTNTGFTLAPAGTLTCTGTYTVTQADIDDNGDGDGDIDNTATADSDETPPDEDSEEVPLIQLPSLAIDKVDNTGTFDSVGDVISYSITVTNDGNITLTNVVVTDPNAPDIDCSAAAGQQTTIPSLAPGASVVCSASHTITQADLDAGHYFNEACADDGEGGADAVCDDVDTPGEQTPMLDIDKTVTDVDGDDTAPFLVDEAGDVISYSILVTNTGNVTLHNVTVSDPLIADLDCDAVEDGLQTSGFTLAPAGTLTCTGTYTVTQADIDDDGDADGDIDNTATADSDETEPEDDSEDVPLVQLPSLAIDKVDNTGSFDSVGDVVSYSITVTNTGNVTLTDVLVTDPNAPNIDCSAAAGQQTTIPSLAPGASVVCSASHTITQADLDAGHYFNEACADDGEGGAAAVCDDVDTPGEQNPVLGIDKSATEAGYDAVGDVIHFTITVTNIGNVTLKNVIVTDLQVTDLDCEPNLPVPTLAAGASFTCTASHTITLQDLDLGSFFNEACTDDELGEPDTGALPVCDDVTVFGEDEQQLTQPPTDISGGGRGGVPPDALWLLLVALGTILATVVVLTPARGRRRA